MKEIKISLIGAGSGCFSLGLIRDLCSSKYLNNCTVSLMDINKERLDAIYELCNRYTKEIGGQMKFEKTLDRIESLKDADYVISTALCASHEQLQDGWKIAQKYGFKFAGSYHVMYDEAFWINFHQLRFMESLTEDILEYCPDAWHLMVSNPVVAGTTHIQRKYPKAKMVGICHGYAMTHSIVEQLGFSKEDVNYQMPGVNHFVWLNEGKIKNEDLFEVLDRWVAEKEAKGEEIIWPMTPKRLDFYRKHGVIGIGDTISWTGASWPWWYHTDAPDERPKGEESPMEGWQGYFTGVATNANRIIETSKDPSAKVSDLLTDVSEDDLMVPLLESLACDIPKVLIVNLLNKGQLVPGLPEDFEVEVPALCNGSGIHPIQTKALPKHMIAHILRDRVAPVEMELEAYNNGSLTFLEELVLMDKWSTSAEQVHNFVQEILDMPCNAEMKKHYK